MTNRDNLPLLLINVEFIKVFLMDDTFLRDWQQRQENEPYTLYIKCMHWTKLLSSLVHGILLLIRLVFLHLEFLSRHPAAHCAQWWVVGTCSKEEVADGWGLLGYGWVGQPDNQRRQKQREKKDFFHCYFRLPLLRRLGHAAAEGVDHVSQRVEREFRRNS